MAQFHNGDLEYIVDDLYDMTGFEDEYDNPFAQNEPETNNDSDPLDSDFEDDFESVQSPCCCCCCCYRMNSISVSNDDDDDDEIECVILTE